MVYSFARLGPLLSLCLSRAIALCILWSAPTVLAADPRDLTSIELKESDHLRGSCESVQEGKLIWRTVYGETVRFPIGEVRTVKVSQPWVLELNDGQSVQGSWQIIDGQLVIQSRIFGELRCSPALMVSAVPAVTGKGLAAESTANAAPATSSSAANAAERTASTSNEAPPSSLQSLLRESSILLRPGEWNLSSGLSYQHSHTLYSPTDSRATAAEFRMQRGITPRFEAEVNWRTYWLNTSTLVVPTSAGGNVTQTRHNLIRSGNPEISGSTLLEGEGVLRPEIVATSGLTIPVNAVKDNALFLTRVGLEFLKTSDPGAIFAGVGWIHELNGWSESQYKLRDLLTYHLGMAIGLNDELAIGFQAQGEYLPAIKDRKEQLIATSVETAEGKFWFNYRLTHHSFAELAFLAPLNDDTHSTTFEFTYILRY